MAMINSEKVPNDLLTAEGVVELFGWTSVKSMDNYVYGNGRTFPEPAFVAGRTRLWERKVVIAWAKEKWGPAVLS